MGSARITTGSPAKRLRSSWSDCVAQTTSALAAFVVDRKFARHLRTPEIKRILRLVIGGRPTLVLRNVVDIARIFGEAAPRVAHVVEIVGAKHMPPETPAFGPALVVHAHGAQADI